MDRLAAMQTFVQIMDGGSLSSAARKSGRSLASIVRTLAHLEAHLDVRLIERTTRRLRLTEEGANYLERARAVISLADEADLAASARRGRPAGRLTVSAPVVFGRLHVAPAVFRLLDREPKLKIRLLLTDRVVNLIEDGFDAAVRIGTLPDSSLRAIAIGTTEWIYCASPSYLKRKGTPNNATALAEHDCPNLTRGEAPDGSSARFVCNNADMLINAALAGQGIVRVLSYQAAEHCRRGRLREVLRHLASPPIPINVVFAHPLLMSARVAAFRDAMLKLRGHLDFNSGRTAGRRASA
jgi:DNA-binding transcriptional LysR family regulator